MRSRREWREAFPRARLLWIPLEESVRPCGPARMNWGRGLILLSLKKVERARLFGTVSSALWRYQDSSIIQNEHFDNITVVLFLSTMHWGSSMFISLINICPAFKSSFTTSLWPDYEARCSGVNPNSLYFSGSAPLSRSTLTTCLWPRFAAWYRGVDSTNPWTQFTSNHPATEECHHLLCIVFYCHVPEFVLIFGYFLFKDTLSLFPKWLRCDSFFPGFAHLMTFLEWFI